MKIFSCEWGMKYDSANMGSVSQMSATNDKKSGQGKRPVTAISHVSLSLPFMAAQSLYLEAFLPS